MLGFVHLYLLITIGIYEISVYHYFGNFSVHLFLPQKKKKKPSPCLSLFPREFWRKKNNKFKYAVFFLALVNYSDSQSQLPSLYNCPPILVWRPLLVSVMAAQLKGFQLLRDPLLLKRGPWKSLPLFIAFSTEMRSHPSPKDTTSPMEGVRCCNHCGFESMPVKGK